MLAVGHNLADHVLGQTDYQAAGKAAPSEKEIADGANPRRGWGACLRHVAQYHLVMAVMLAIVWAVLPLWLSWTGLAVGLTISVLTHAFLDRRWPVRWLLEHIGSKGFAELKSAGMNGMYLTGQALHHMVGQQVQQGVYPAQIRKSSRTREPPSVGSASAQSPGRRRTAFRHPHSPNSSVRRRCRRMPASTGRPAARRVR
ncbi:hypothetical protein [Streptomyces acidicola]|uniref:hypothetical protein n=1 Tax=Streptomyces acidicola TaxID=2596892 RepID=UPI00342B3394